MGSRDHRVTVGFALRRQRRPRRGVLGRPPPLREPDTRHRAPRPPASRRRGCNNTWRDADAAALEANPRIPEPYRAADHRRAVADGRAHPPRPRHRRRQPVELESLHQSPDVADGERRDRVAGLQPALEPRPAHHADASRPATSCGRRPRRSAATSTTRGTSGRARYQYTQPAQHRHRGRRSSAASPAQAPLFERFTLGDSSTLRGWNKFDIAPDRRRPGVPSVARVPLPRRRRSSSTPARCGTDGDIAQAARLHRVRLPQRQRVPDRGVSAERRRRSDATFMMGVRF